MSSEEGMQPLDLEETVWCEGCRKLKKEINRLQEEHTINYQTLKQKIISTDLLIRKYRTKCEEYDVQSKRLEETSRRLDRSQLDCEMLETQLKASLQSTEPLKQARIDLEGKLKVKDTEIQNLKNSLEGAEMMRKQYEALISANEIMLKEEDRKQLEKKMQSLESSNSKYANTLRTNKEELKSLKLSISKSSRDNKLLETKLGRAVTKLETYYQILKDNDLVPRGDKRPCQTKIKGDTKWSVSQEEDEDSDINESRIEEVNNNSPVGGVGCNEEDDVVSECDGADDEDNYYESSDEDDFDNIDIPSMEFRFTFSPICDPMSPLPPSPAPRKAVKNSTEDNEDSIDAMANNLQSQLLEDSSESFPKSVRRSPRLKGKTDTSLFSSGDEHHVPARKEQTNKKHQAKKTKPVKGFDKKSIKPSPKLKSKLDFKEKEESGFDFDDVVPEISDSESESDDSVEERPVINRKGSAPFLVQHLIKEVRRNKDVKESEDEEDMADGVHLDVSEPQSPNVTRRETSDFKKGCEKSDLQKSQSDVKETGDEKDVTEVLSALSETNKLSSVEDHASRITRSMSQPEEKTNIPVSPCPKSAMNKIQFLTPPPPKSKRLRAVSPRTNLENVNVCKQPSRKRTVSLPSDLSDVETLGLRRSPRSRSSDKEEIHTSPLSKKSRSQSEGNLKKGHIKSESDLESPVRVLRSRSVEPSGDQCEDDTVTKTGKMKNESKTEIANMVCKNRGLKSQTKLGNNSTDSNTSLNCDQSKGLHLDKITLDVSGNTCENGNEDNEPIEFGGTSVHLDQDSTSITKQQRSVAKGKASPAKCHREKNSDNLLTSTDITAGDASEQDSSESDIFAEKQRRPCKSAAERLKGQNSSTTKQTLKPVISSDSDSEPCKNTEKTVINRSITKKRKSPKKVAISSDSDTCSKVKTLKNICSQKDASPRKSVIENTSESDKEAEDLKKKDSDVSLYLSSSDSDAENVPKKSVDKNSVNPTKEATKPSVSLASSSDSEQECAQKQLQSSVIRETFPKRTHINMKKRESGRRVNERININPKRITSKEFISTESDSDEDIGDTKVNQFEQKSETSKKQCDKRMEMDPVHNGQTEEPASEGSQQESRLQGSPGAPVGKRQRGRLKSGRGRESNGQQTGKKYPLRALTYPKLSDSFIKVATLLPGSSVEEVETVILEKSPDVVISPKKEVVSVKSLVETQTSSDEGKTMTTPSPSMQRKRGRPLRQRHVPLETDKEFVDIILERRRITRSVSDGSSSEARKLENENKAMSSQVGERTGNISKRTEMFMEKLKNTSEKLKSENMLVKGNFYRLKSSAKLEDSAPSSDDVQSKGQITQPCPGVSSASEMEGVANVGMSVSTANSVTDSDVQMSDMDTIKVVVYQDEVLSSAAESVMSSPATSAKSQNMNVTRRPSVSMVAEKTNSDNMNLKEGDSTENGNKQRDKMVEQDHKSASFANNFQSENKNSAEVSESKLDNIDSECLQSSETTLKSAASPTTGPYVQLKKIMVVNEKHSSSGYPCKQDITSTVAETDVANSCVLQGQSDKICDTSENEIKKVTATENEKKEKEVSSKIIDSANLESKSASEASVEVTVQDISKTKDTEESSFILGKPELITPSSKLKRIKMLEPESSHISDAKDVSRLASQVDNANHTQDDQSGETAAVAERGKTDRMDTPQGKKELNERKQKTRKASKPEEMKEKPKDHSNVSKENSDVANDQTESVSVKDSAGEADDSLNEENDKKVCPTIEEPKRRTVMKRQMSFDHDEVNSATDKDGNEKTKCELHRKRKDFLAIKNKSNVVDGNEINTDDALEESSKTGQIGKIEEGTTEKVKDITEKTLEEDVDVNCSDVDLIEAEEIEAEEIEGETDEDSDGGKRKRVETQHSFGFVVNNTDTAPSTEGSSLLDSLSLIPELVECEEESETFADDGADSRSILSELGSHEPDRVASPEIVSLTQKSSFTSISALIRDEFSTRASTSSPLPPSPMNFLRILAPVSPLPSSPSRSCESPDDTLTSELTEPAKKKKKKSKKSKKEREVPQTQDNSESSKLAPLDETISAISGPQKRIARVASQKTDLPKFGANLPTTTVTVKPKAVYSRVNSVPGGDNTTSLSRIGTPEMSLAKQQLVKRQQSQQEKEKKTRKRKSSESEAVPQKKKALPPTKTSPESSTALEKELQKFMVSAEYSVDSFLQAHVHSQEVSVVAMEIFRAVVKVLQMSNIDQLHVVVTACTSDSRDMEETFLTDTETRLLDLLATMMEQYEDCPRHQLMELLWNSIFLSCTLSNGRMALCRIFTALCRCEGDIEQVRVFIFKLLTCGYIQYVEPIMAIVSVWPITLRAGTDVSPIIQVIRHVILNTCQTETASENIKKLAPCFQAMCEWSPLTETPQHLLCTVIEKLKLYTAAETESSRVFETMKSIELLLWIHGWKFLYVNFFMRHLVAVADSWKAKGDNSSVNPKYALTLIRILGNVYHLPRFVQNHKEFSKGLKRCLIPVLDKPTEHKELTMCCAEVLAELSPFHPHFIMDVLSQWYKKNQSVVSSNTRLKLEETRQFLSSKITAFGVDAFI